MSLALPAPNAVTIFTGFEGQACEKAGPVINTAKLSAKVRHDFTRPMIVSP
jgi:hypothetical protein